MKKIQMILTTVLLALVLPMVVACGEKDEIFEMAPPPQQEEPDSLGHGHGDGMNDGKEEGEKKDSIGSDGTMSGSSSTYHFATVITPGIPKDSTGITHPTEIEDDKEGQLFANPDILIEKDANRKGQRILYDYDFMDGGYRAILITALQVIPTKTIDFLKAGETDTYGKDGIHLTGYTRSKQHLTFQFQIYTAGGSHRISLVAKDGAKPDSKGILTLQLRHRNESGQASGLSKPSYVSFLMTDAPGYEDGSLKGFRIEYTNLDDVAQTLTIQGNRTQQYW